MTNIRHHQILNDFLNGLRSVGASYNERELSTHTIQKIDTVKVLFDTIQQEGLDYEEEITKLSEQCDWDLKLLLADTLRYPEVIPRVRKLNGNLHFIFKDSPPPPPLRSSVKQELIQLASIIQDEIKREELLALIHEEEHLLYVTSELCKSIDLNTNEKERAGKLFGYFY